MIRRIFPKGTDFDKVRPAEVNAVETWLNSYPREILGYRSASSVFAEAVLNAA
jgi:IS30 family transposase